MEKTAPPATDMPCTEAICGMPRADICAFEGKSVKRVTERRSENYHIVENSTKMIPIWKDLVKISLRPPILKPELDNTRWPGAAGLPLRIPLERCDRSRTRREDKKNAYQCRYMVVDFLLQFPGHGCVS